MKQNQENNSQTVLILTELSKCENISELKEIIGRIVKIQKEQWTKKINELITESGLTKTRFADICGVSRVAVDKWCKGSIPKNRETFLRIGMAAGYEVDKMNQLLQRYGHYPKLYPKSLEDCVCKFVLDKQYGEKSLEQYNYILTKIKNNIIRNDESTEDMSTELFDEKLSDVQNEDELESFIRDYSASFATAYQKFYAYVKANILANYQMYNKNVYEFALAQEWSSSLKQCVSAIRQGKWYPTRNKIISLGLHLSMDHEQIDKMLELAYMEPLCAKNAFESVIMFILDDASLNNILDKESEKFDQDGLCKYARNILKEFNLPEINSFLAELPEMDDDE